MLQARPKVAIALLTALSAIGLLIIPTTAMGLSSPTLYRLNAGGAALAGEPQWTRDSSRNPSTYVTSPSSKTSFTSKPVSTNHTSLPGYVPSSVFKTMRNAPSSGAMSFSFPVNAGAYDVRLYFAEIRAKQMAPGARVMNVSLENTTVLSNYDVFKDVGGHRGVMKSYPVTSDETLNIRITATNGRPMVNGLEIIATGGTQDPEPEPAPSPEPEPSPQPAPVEDECVGTEVVPDDSLEAMVEEGEIGEVFCIASGTYLVTTITMKDGQVLDGEGTVHPGTTRGEDRPSVSIKGSAYTVISGGDGVTLKDVAVTDPAADTNCDTAPICGEAISPAKSWLILRSRVHHADAQCIGGAAPGLFIEDTELDHCGNRFDGPDNNGFAAAIKSVTGYTIEDSYVHDSNQGVWCDHDCSGDAFVVSNSIVEDNCSFGIHYEYTYRVASTPAAAFITDNIVRGNNWCDLPAKADLGIVSAQNATVTGNLLGATATHPQSGYGFTAFDRGMGLSTGIASNNKLGGDEIHRCEAPYVCK